MTQTEIIRHKDLGRADLDWLEARHHFSFAHYHDPKRMGYGPLRVWNDDIIAPGRGFDPHPHKDMEIVTYVRQGAITHEDSTGNKGRTSAGAIQVMSAGDGIRHSEYNLEDIPTKLFQIWFVPRSAGGRPWWEMADAPAEGEGFVTVASGFKQDLDPASASKKTAPIALNADAALRVGNFSVGQSADFSADSGFAHYIVVDEGKFTFEHRGQKHQLAKGDALYLDAGDTAKLSPVDQGCLVVADLLM